MDISTRAMLVNLSIGIYSSSKTDKAVTEDVTRQHNAAADAGRFNKKLLDKKAMAEIKGVCTRARQYHYENTLPWSNEGPRILPTARFAAYDKEMRTIKDDFDIAIKNFIVEYPDYVKDAESRMGSLFLAEDYPSAGDVGEKFTWVLDILPLPSSNDFRVELSKDVTDHLKKEMDTRNEETVRKATLSVWQRAFDSISHVVNKLEDYKVVIGTDGKSKVENAFRDSLINNVAGLAELLPALNIANDPKLNKLADDLKNRLTSHSPDDLRKDESLRTSTAKDARKILEEIQETMDAY